MTSAKAHPLTDLLRPPPTSNDVPGYTDWLRQVSPEYRWDWPHLAHVRRHLADVTRGTCRRLILSMPPQHGKSEGLTVRYPVWRMAREPGLRVAVAAYNQTHANRFSRKSRKLARGRLPLSAERKAANEWETTAGGSYVAVGVGAGITGLPVDALFLDDPVKNREEADSTAHQERVWEWYMDDLTTRLQYGAPVVLVMTRWHEGDLAGRILASADGPSWRYVRLPALAELDDPLGRPEGAPLCPDLHPLADLEEKRRVLGEGFTGLYQQLPVPRGGLFFKRAWFEGADDDLPGKSVKRIRYWDLAATKKDTSAYTAGVLMATDRTRFRVENVIRERLMPAERNELIRRTAEQDMSRPGFERTWFEGAPGLGVEVSQALVRTMQGLPVRVDEIGSAGKEQRAEPFADAARGGLVSVVRTGWTDAYLSELAGFPRGQFKDQVDSSSGAFNKLARPHVGYASA